MKKIKLGHSDLNVTIEGYGCMGLSEFYGLTSDKDADRMLERVIERIPSRPSENKALLYHLMVVL